MIKLGLFLLGTVVVVAPIGYKIYGDFGTNQMPAPFNPIGRDIKEKSNSEESLIIGKQSTEVEEMNPIPEIQNLSEDQQKILNWSKDNGGCKVRVYNPTSAKYMEIQKLEKDVDVSGLLDALNTLKGACSVSNPDRGIRKGADDAIEGIMMKKQINGKWDVEEPEDSELED